ncbi:MAG: chorismate synthase, partial [Anaerovorax sp.]
MGSVWGKFLKISIFGESHGSQIGAVMDGFPPGFTLDMENIMEDMERRAPGKSKLTTGRKESDLPIVVSGIFKEKTTGAPFCVLINNKDTKSGDYEPFSKIPRPSHSDFTGHLRYKGCNDFRGGGHFSGRLTAPLVFAGALCKGYLKKQYGVEITGEI